MPWLMKAEPDSRIVKGKDVKFSVDEFEKLGVSPWDGVRGHEAKAIMRDRMKLGDKVLFYHSNCKVPGVFALAEIAKEGYPDYTAWDPSHPYFDEKTDQDSPTWYMVDVKFIQRLEYPPTLSLIKLLASSSSLPSQVEYITQDGFEAIKTMQLVNRGRLSVQPVTETAYQAIVKLGTMGGWESLIESTSKGKKRKEQMIADDQEKTVNEEVKVTKPASKRGKKVKSEANGMSQPDQEENQTISAANQTKSDTKKKNGNDVVSAPTGSGLNGLERRSGRLKR